MAAGATVITFDGMAQATLPNAVRSLNYNTFKPGFGPVVDGFALTGTNNGYPLGIYAPQYGGDAPSSPYAYNGTDVMRAVGGFALQAVDGATFTLNSLDASRWNIDNGPISFTVTGVKADASLVTLKLTTSGVNNTVESDLETFTFSDFTDLRSFKVVIDRSPNLALGIDNIVLDVAEVPEPATLGIVGLGLALLGMRRRRG